MANLVVVNLLPDILPDKSTTNAIFNLAFSPLSTLIFLSQISSNFVLSNKRYVEKCGSCAVTKLLVPSHSVAISSNSFVSSL